MRKNWFVFFCGALFQDGKRKVHVEIIPVDAVESDEADKIRQATQFNQKALTPVEDFLSGRECLHGGVRAFC